MITEDSKFRRFHFTTRIRSLLFLLWVTTRWPFQDGGRADVSWAVECNFYIDTFHFCAVTMEIVNATQLKIQTHVFA